MKTSLIIDALGLPPESRVDQRIATKLLVENGSTAAADKKTINEVIDELTWVAALKSSNCGVPVYKDEEREYIEIAVVLLSFRDGARIGGAKALMSSGRTWSRPFRAARACPARKRPSEPRGLAPRYTSALLRVR